MAGCSIVLLALIALPIMMGIILVIFGILGGAVLLAIISTVLIVVLSKTGVFSKYSESEITWQRVLAKAGKVLLIIVLVLSLLMAMVSGMAVYQLGTISTK